MSGLGLEGSFLHLNVNGVWGGFAWHGLELRGDGSLTLATVPRASPPLLEGLDSAAAPAGPAGVVVTPDGTLYYTDPGRDLVYRHAVCDEGTGPAPCLDGTGDRPGSFRRPRGLAFDPRRCAILVADSGNHRIQLLNAESSRLIGIWGQAAGRAPSPGTKPGRFDTPWALALDSEGYAYVVERGNRRVQKLNIHGDPVADFWRTASRSEAARSPVDVAVVDGPEGIEIYVLDESRRGIVVLDSDGNVVRRMPGVTGPSPMGLATDGVGIYVGDNERRRLIRHMPDGEPVGHALGYEGPVASLTLGGDGSMWLHPGSGFAPLPLESRSAYARTGVMSSGPLALDGGFHADGRTRANGFSHEWHELKAFGAPPPDGAGVEFYVHQGDDAAADAPPVPQKAGDVFTAPWRRLPQRGFQGLIGGSSRYLWLGARLVSEGQASACVEQIRVDIDSQTYIEFLPAIYRKDQPSREQLEALLALMESFFCDVEERIRDLPEYFDPQAAPEEWLSWLAGWLAVELPEGWPADRKRAAIARAFEAYARRGTPAGLRESLLFWTGRHVRIDEPLSGANWWLLPAQAPSAEAPATGDEQGVFGSRLGISTVLAPAEPQGAVVGTTATLDRSQLTQGDEFGAPVFDDVAHRFTVSLYGASELCEAELDRIRQVIEREKPVHTAYELCHIEPRMRVGFQAILGIDTVVASPTSAREKPRDERAGLWVGGEPTGRLGTQSEIGKSTRLG